MSQIPAYYPTTPFVGEIPGGGRPNFVVKVKGKLNGHGRCNIDFVNSPSLNPSLDIVFHLSARSKEKTIVANSFQFGQWGEEVSFGKNARIRKDETFTLSIMSEGNQSYNVRLNGEVLGPFRQRLPLELVQYIRVTGENLAIEHVLTGDGMLFHFDQ